MKNYKIIILFIVIYLTFTSCKKNEDIVTEIQPEKGAVKIGRKLDNPYSVTNMKKAFNNLMQSEKYKGSKFKAEMIETTHYYMRFLPADSSQVSALLFNNDIETFAYPLDYEVTIEGGGVYYADPEDAPSEPTWQYTVVPVNYTTPNMTNEVLEACYMPELPDKGSEEYNQFLIDLEVESYKLTGNEALLNKEYFQFSKSTNVANFNGTLTVRNTTTTTTNVYDGIAGVKVRARNFTKIANAWTTASGFYRVDKSFITNVYVDLVFENNRGFKIWGNGGFYVPATYMFGQHMNTLSRNFETNSIAWLWATTNNATYDYFDKCTQLGILQPPSNMVFWNFRMNGEWGGSAPMARHIRLDINSLADFAYFYFRNMISGFWYTRFALMMPDIFILLDNSVNDSRVVYETVYHELAHASHYRQVGSTFWRNYITHIVTNFGYGNGNEPLAGYAGVGEIWGNYFGSTLGRNNFGGSRWGDPFEDWYNPGYFMDLDDINGFTEQLLFNALNSNIHTINDLRNELIRLYPTRTAAINAQFNSYFP